jgi:importin subunit beta-1
MTQPFEAQLSSCLQNAQSLDKNTREQAEEYIRRAEEENWGAFLLALSQELARDGGPVASRQMAGLLLKNSLDAKDSHIQVSSCVAHVAVNVIGRWS